MSKKILLIEDEEYLVDIYKMKLEHEGYIVIVAEDGEGGVSLARSERPDLVLLDLILPKMDGFQVLRELRSGQKTKDLKIYILSNLGQDEEIDQGFRDGADGYLLKTNITPGQLAKNIEKMLSGKPVGIKKKLTF